MERLPYIDEHVTIVAAGPERTWAALLAVARASGGGAPPRPIARVLRLEPPRGSGDWDGEDVTGVTLPGFRVEEATAPARLALRGRHRFSRYALAFEIDDAGDGRSRVRARSWAEFPGLPGRIYRALVIGSGAHRLVVRRLLRQVARSA